MYETQVKEDRLKWSSSGLLARAIEIINNRKHSVLKYPPFELLRQRRNVGFLAREAAAAGLPFSAADPVLTPDEIDTMHKSAQAAIVAQGNKMVQRSTDSDFEPFKVGETVWVLAFRQARGRKTLHRLMEPAAEVVEFHEPDRYHLRWITQGPHVKDTPGTVSSRIYHHA